jgi:hypothetical protein
MKQNDPFLDGPLTLTTNMRLGCKYLLWRNNQAYYKNLYIMFYNTEPWNTLFYENDKTFSYEEVSISIKSKFLQNFFCQ